MRLQSLGAGLILAIGAGCAAPALAQPAPAQPVPAQPVPAHPAPAITLRVTRVLAPAFGGRRFGAVGQYEEIDAVAEGALDPTAAANASIQDLALAARDATGRVAYHMDVRILMPIDPARGRRTLLYDVVNRGRPLADSVFDVSPDEGFLEQQGFTLVWSGWQADLPPDKPGLLRLQAPPLAQAISGKVRKEFTLFHPTSTLGLGDTALGRGIAYPVLDLDEPGATLTARVHQADAPQSVARADWAFADCRQRPFPGVASATQICLRGGFDTNHIYDLIYTARNPYVAGVGFAATRDLIAFLRHTPGADNPLAGRVDFALAHGTSQSGRYLRSFLDLGFNQDLAGQRVFDGMSVHIAAMRLALNQRFAQPGAAAMQHEEHLAPVGDAPFTWAPLRDPLTGQTAGILDRCRASHSCPAIFQAVSSVEYWNSRMSLDTTDGAGHDVALPPEVHVYHFASTQHVPAMRGRICQYPANPNPYAEGMRALIVRLQALVARGQPAPASRYPRVADGTLVSPTAMHAPAIPGFAFTGLDNQVPVEDRGPAFDPRLESGVLGEPPRPRPGASYVVLVPAVDADGNEIDGIRSVRLQVPLGTYTGWNLRRAGYSGGDLCYLLGSFIPFARTAATRGNDPRPSLAERYPTHEAYVAAIDRAVAAQESAGFLLPADGDRLRAEAAAVQLP